VADAEHYTTRIAGMFILLYTRDGHICSHQLRPGDTVVGRAPVCDLTIDDPSISRRHVRFRVHGDHCVLTDLGGRNGTFLNGEQVTEAEVKAGDAIVLGRFPIRLDRASAEPLVLSDQHSLIDSGRTLIRRVDEDLETRAGSRSEANPERLLLLLSQIARQLVHWGPLQDILDRIVTVVLDTVPVERAFLLLIDERTGEVVPRVIRSRDRLPVSGVSVSRTVVRRAIQERVAILASDVLLEAGFAGAHSLHSGNVRSFMCTPLWNQSRVIGVIYVDNPNTAELGVADLDVLQALGAYAAVAIEQSRLTERLLEETRVRDRLQRYHSAAVVDRILATACGPAGDVPFLAEERDVTVLFADIVGFTGRTEHMSPSAVAHLLNQCLTVLCETVFAEEGTLDKFVGDAVLAVFGAPLSQPDHADRALRAAKAMREAVAGLGIDPPIELRIALNSGTATAGDIGSPKRREYTVLGDVVNTCARMVKSACEPGQVVLSASTRERLEGEAGLHPLGPVQLRGRDTAVELFALGPR
jgi:adenylate cyclase